MEKLSRHALCLPLVYHGSILTLTIPSHLQINMNRLQCSGVTPCFHIVSSDPPNAGERAPPEDGALPAHEHLPAPGGRSDAEDHSSGPQHADRPQAGDRRDDRHEREPARRPGLHVRRTDSCELAEGLMEQKRF